MTSALVVPNIELINYPPEFNTQVVAALTVASSEITALQGAGGGLDWKNSVLCATTAALAANTRVGNVLTANANGALGAIDGITPTAGKRMLVKDEVTQANNGIFDVTSAGAGGAPWVLTRSSDADESAEVTPNLAVMVERGSSNQDKIFVLDIDGPVTLNTTALVFTDWRGIAITAPATVGTANAVGTGVTLARADHVHDHGAQTTATHHAVATGIANGFMSSADFTKLSTVQGGTATLIGGTLAIATANITANSRVLINMKDFGAGAITGLAALAVPDATRVVGAPGSFTVNAVDDAKALIVTAVCTFDWFVFN